MDNDTRIKLRALLIQQEDMRLKPYTDTTGNLTIGVGRNLTVRGISQTEALGLLDDDIDYFVGVIQEKLPWASQLDDTRLLGVISVSFNCGIIGLLEFKEMLDALENKNWTKASQECLNSRAASIAPARYKQIASIFMTGKI
jgi:lysozyme